MPTPAPGRSFSLTLRDTGRPSHRQLQFRILLIAPNLAVLVVVSFEPELEVGAFSSTSAFALPLDRIGLTEKRRKAARTRRRRVMEARRDRARAVRLVIGNLAETMP